MLNGYIPGLRYNIKGSVATSRGMPTPFFFSRLPEALCGLMTKQTPFMHIHNTVSSPSIALIKHSLNSDYIKTSNNRLSEKRPTSVQRTNHLSPIDYNIYVSNLPRSGHLTIHWSSDTDKARMDTRCTICSTNLPLRKDKCHAPLY